MSSEALGLNQRLASMSESGDAPVVARAFDSPVGPLVAAATDDGLVLLEFGATPRLGPQLTMLNRHFGKVRAGDHPFIDQAERELAEYFEGKRQAFSVPLLIRGTPFQESVWQALREIPFGETRAYSEVAVALGLRNGQRAVGLANGQNRISIIIPCHRVIERGGGLRGYGGGLERKRFLLDLERRQSDPLAGTPLGRPKADSD
jgi:AraC family transcriptional regulator of adaptative response/methylated-DNA-[protein]-cysteine methyltransferase